MSKGRATSIPSTDWPSLRDLFLIEWPKHIVPHSLLQNYIYGVTRIQRTPGQVLKFIVWMRIGQMARFI